MIFLHSIEEFRERLNKLGIHLRDLVVYLTSACNLRCRHCYLGDELLSAAARWDTDSIARLLETSVLDRLTLLGGEPLLYKGIHRLLEVLKSASILEKRITTNLTVLRDESLELLRQSDVRVVVSVDGPTASRHDAIRGGGSFDLTVSNLEKLRLNGIDVEVTTTVTRHTVQEFNELVALLRVLRIKKLNLHKISPHGNAIGNPELMLTPSEWRQFVDHLGEVSQADSDRQIAVRYPLLFATHQELSELAEAGYRHHAFGSYYSKDGHRVVLYPDGQVFVSSEAFGTDSAIGSIRNGAFVASGSNRSELVLSAGEDFSISRINPLLSGDSKYPVALSFSFKRFTLV